jgi:hypothetical protein
MGSLIKTFYNNKLYHDAFAPEAGSFALSEVDFTKVLTKYSTEYNNQLFLYGLCQKMNMDKNDLVAFFHEMRIIHGSTSATSSFPSPAINNPKYKMNKNMEWILKMEESLAKDNIDLLDIKRMYRFLDKNVKKEEERIEEMEEDTEEEEDYEEDI